MNSLESFLLVLVCVGPAAGAIAGHAIGVGRARTLDTIGRRDAWQRGYRQGRADTIEDLEVEHANARALPKKITQAMPLVPVSVDGDEPPYPPKPAADVRDPA